ncbi:hypothetical protein MMC07_001069 [Pseudocyphellaria aurata]|nr:hypothetical protein [Pseudocyphellaria aurata]
MAQRRFGKDHCTHVAELQETFLKPLPTAAVSPQNAATKPYWKIIPILLNIERCRPSSNKPEGLQPKCLQIPWKVLEACYLSDSGASFSSNMIL